VEPPPGQAAQGRAGGVEPSEPPQHHPHPRCFDRADTGLCGDGVLSGWLAGALLQLRQAAADTPHDRHRLQVLHGARSCLPAGHRASRHQAGQHPRRRRGQREDHRLRACAQHQQEARYRLDLHHGCGLAGLHEPGADQGLPAQPEDRPLFAGRPAFPSAHGPIAFPRQQPCPAGVQDHQCRSALGVATQSGCARADGRGDPQGAGEGSVLTLSQWRRVRQGSCCGALPDPR